MKIRGFLHLCIGEEAVAVGVLPSISPEDAVVSTYREHGHALARGISARAILAEMYGKREIGAGAEARCTFSIEPRASTGATPSWRRRASDRRRARARGPDAEAEERHLLLLRRGRRRRRRVPRVHEPLGALAASPCSLPARTTSMPWGRRFRNRNPFWTWSRKRRATASQPPRSMAWMCCRWRRRPAPPPRACERRGCLTSWSFEPTAFAPTRCSTPSSTGPRRKSRSGRSDPIEGLARILSERGLLEDADWRRIDDEAAREIADAVEFAEAGALEPVEDLTRFVQSERSLR